MPVPTRFDHRSYVEKLLLAHGDGLFEHCRWLTRRREDAKDLFGKTCLNALRFAHQFRPGTNFRAWIYKIAKNAWINVVKERKRRPPTEAIEQTIERLGLKAPDSLSAWATPGNGGDPAEIIFERLPDQNVKQALSELPDEFRIPVLLCDVNDFSYKEIAKMLRIPLGTVRSRIFRGRRRIRKALAGSKIAERLKPKRKPRN